MSGVLGFFVVLLAAKGHVFSWFFAAVQPRRV